MRGGGINIQHEIIHYTTQHRIYVDTDTLTLRINESEISSLDIRDIEIFAAIVEKHPSILTYDEIITLVLKKYNIEIINADPLLYIRKKKWYIQKSIAEAACDDSIPVLIDTIRGVGYRLGNGWQKEKKHTARAETVLDKIGKILEEVVLLEEKIPLQEIVVDFNKIIALNTDGFSERIDILLHRFLKLSKELLEAIGLTPFETVYVQVESVLYVIRSYISMSRHGSGITNEEWRKEFKDELHNHFKNLTIIAKHQSSLKR